MRDELITILIAIVPTLEAHGAIATAIGVFKFSALKAFLLASLGTVGITPFILIFLNYMADMLMRHVYFLNRFLTWLFSYTRRKHAHRFNALEGWDNGSETSSTKRIDFLKAVVLYVFVAIPGPLTGVWGGALAAFVFGVPFFHSAVALILGAITVAAIDAFAIGGILQAFLL